MQVPGLIRNKNWRGFIAEIGVIVIGVLIALAAGNVAEAWNWQRKVDKGEQQLLAESNTNLIYAAEQVVVGPCLDAQLVGLRDRVLASGSALTPAAAYTDDFGTFVFRAPSRPYADGIWQALNDDGTSVHMDKDRQQIHSLAYEQLNDLRQMRAESDLVTGRLLTLAHPLPLDAGTRATLVGALEEQRARSRLQSLIAGQIMGNYRDLGTPKRIEPHLLTSGTVAFCRKQGLPVDNWRQVMASQEPSLTP